MMFGRKVNSISKRKDISLDEKLKLVDGLFEKKLGTFHKIEKTIEIIGSIIFIFLVSFLILFMIFKEALFIDEAGTVKYLESKGFDTIEITGYNISGCDQKPYYLHRTTFTAINTELKMRAEGTVCTAMKKGVYEPIIDYKSINSFKNLTIKNFKKEQ